jgi:hypothetical protein
VRRYHLGAFLLEGGVEQVGIVSAISYRPLGLLGDEAGFEGFFN